MHTQVQRRMWRDKLMRIKKPRAEGDLEKANGDALKKKKKNADEHMAGHLCVCPREGGAAKWDRGERGH